MSEETKNKTCLCDKCSCVVQVMHALGKFLIGVAALVGVCKAPKVVENIYKIQTSQAQHQAQNQGQSQVNNISINAFQEMQKLIEKSKTESPAQLIKEIPSTPKVENGVLQNVYISKNLKPELKQKLIQAKNDEERSVILNDYFRKTIQFSNEDIE